MISGSHEDIARTSRYFIKNVCSARITQLWRCTGEAFAFFFGKGAAAADGLAACVTTSHTTDCIAASHLYRLFGGGHISGNWLNCWAVSHSQLLYRSPLVRRCTYEHHYEKRNVVNMEHEMEWNML